MYGKTRTNQGGSVASFLVVGVILAAITLGGIYFVQQRNDSGRVATSPTPSPSASIPGGSPSVSQTPPPSKTPSSSPSVTPKPSSSPAPTSHPTTGTAPAGNLPATGPSDLLVAVVPAALLIGTTIGYLKSYRTRFGR